MQPVREIVWGLWAFNAISGHEPCILRPDQLNALLRHIKLSVSQQHPGHFRFFNVVVIGHTKQRRSAGLLGAVSQQKVR